MSRTSSAAGCRKPICWRSMPLVSSWGSLQDTAESGSLRATKRREPCTMIYKQQASDPAPFRKEPGRHRCSTVGALTVVRAALLAVPLLAPTLRHRDLSSSVSLTSTTRRLEQLPHRRCSGAAVLLGGRRQ